MHEELNLPENPHRGRKHSEMTPEEQLEDHQIRRQRLFLIMKDRFKNLPTRSQMITKAHPILLVPKSNPKIFLFFFIIPDNFLLLLYNLKSIHNKVYSVVKTFSRLDYLRGIFFTPLFISKFTLRIDRKKMNP